MGGGLEGKPGQQAAAVPFPPSPPPPHQVELRKLSDRAIMSERLKCMLKRDTGKTI